MPTADYVFTSESVSEGHPDKVADQISDAILDSYLKDDFTSRVACETLVKHGIVILGGEITSCSAVNIDSVVRDVVRSIGYDDPELGFDAETVKIHTYINRQSPDISMGVSANEGKEQGAGDQGLMFGFACNETPELMPLPISLSHQLLRELSRVRKSDSVDFLRPDAKSQVSVRYVQGKPSHVDTIVLSTQHSDDVSLKTLEEFVIENVIKKVISPSLVTKNTRFLINPTGRFVIGGPMGDCGLTGRKIIVDTYGGYSRHGGGAFSGKDPSKVDRSAAYAARYVAKNIVASGLAAKCEVQVAYAIGVAKPVSLYVDTFGTGKVPEAALSKAIAEVFDLTPRGLITSLDLLRPIYLPTATYGHFGRNPGQEKTFTWERTDKTEALNKAVR